MPSDSCSGCGSDSGDYPFNPFGKPLNGPSMYKPFGKGPSTYRPSLVGLVGDMEDFMAHPKICEEQKTKLKQLLTELSSPTKYSDTKLARERRILDKKIRQVASTEGIREADVAEALRATFVDGNDKPLQSLADTTYMDLVKAAQAAHAAKGGGGRGGAAFNFGPVLGFYNAILAFLAWIVSQLSSLTSQSQQPKPQIRPSEPQSQPSKHQSDSKKPHAASPTPTPGASGWATWEKSTTRTPSSSTCTIRERSWTPRPSTQLSRVPGAPTFPPVSKFPPLPSPEFSSPVPMTSGEVQSAFEYRMDRQWYEPGPSGTGATQKQEHPSQ